jgi:FkbM family methyltransferase
VRTLRERAVDGLRAFAGRPRLLPLTALLLRAAIVRPAALFAARELLRRRTVAEYGLRGAPVRVVVRHRSADPVTLGEVFHDGQYLPPPPVEEALSANGGPGEILDLGANVGYFGAFCLTRWPNARLTAFEPDPGNAEVLERFVAANGRARGWMIKRAAAAANDGEAQFVAGLASLSHLVDALPGEDYGPDHGEPQRLVVPTEDVLPRIVASDLVKIDIEGGEWDLLRDRRFRDDPPRALVLEYHPHPSVTGAPRAELERLLHDAGLAIEPIFHRADGYGMVWAYRR